MSTGVHGRNGNVGKQRWFEGAAWRAAGHALGLTPYRSRGSFLECTSWDAMARCVGAPMGPSLPDWADMLVGRFAGRDVFVSAADVRSQVVDPIFSFMPARTRPEGTWTHAVARVWPPLGIGLIVDSTRGRSMPNDLHIGHQGFDASFAVCANDPAQALALLGRQGRTPELAEMMVDVVCEGVVLAVTDDHVRVGTGACIVDARRLDTWLRGVTWIAGELEARRQAIAP